MEWDHVDMEFRPYDSIESESRLIYTLRMYFVLLCSLMRSLEDKSLSVIKILKANQSISKPHIVLSPKATVEMFTCADCYFIYHVIP